MTVTFLGLAIAAPLAARDRLSQIAKIDTNFRFIKCTSEFECLRILHEELQANRTSTVLAEFIQYPKKGIAVYRNR